MLYRALLSHIPCSPKKRPSYIFLYAKLTYIDTRYTEAEVTGNTASVTHLYEHHHHRQKHP